MIQEYTVAGEECMTAAQTRQHDEEKHTGIRTDGENKKSRKQGTKKKQERRTPGVHSNKASRLCYEAEPGTLSHCLPSSSCSRRQRYQVSLLPLSPPPPSVNKSTKTKQNYQDSRAVATRVPLISRTGTVPHDLPFHFCIRQQRCQYGCPLPLFPCRHSWCPLLRGVASCSPLRPCATLS